MMLRITIRFLLLLTVTVSLAHCKRNEPLSESDIESLDYPADSVLKLIPHSGSWDNQQNPLNEDLYKVKTSSLESAKSDLFDLTNGSKIKPGLSIDITSDTSARIAKVAQMPLADMTTAPGNAFIRDKNKIIELVKNFRLFKKSQEKIILNIITDNSNGVGKLSSVDVWSGSEQLVAMMRAGVTTIDKIPRENMVVLVNGCTSGKKECWKHWIRAAGADIRLNYNEDPPSFPFKHLSSDRGAIEVEGNISNFKLGSRTSLGRLNQSLERKMPKIALSIITGDPPHAGHLALSKHALKNEGIDEAIILVNDAGHKKATTYVHRSNMTSLLSDTEANINVVQRMYKKFDDGFGRDALIERIQNIYGTTDVSILEGQDAFERNLKNLGGNLETKLAKYIVFPRKGAGDVITIPENLKARVRIAAAHDDQGLSSTLLREALRKGSEIKASWISKSVAEYIEQWKLFGAGLIKLVP